MSTNLTNTRPKDSSAKIIFRDPTLCAQFLRGYVDIPMLKDVRPEDIEDVTERYLHMFTEERDADVVKRVNLNSMNMPSPFFVISLIEHKSQVDYNVVMQIFRYMAFIWEDYEREMEKQHKGISHTKDFRYPPILPIIFYDGPNEWTAAINLHDRLELGGIPAKYIPDYQCILVQLRDYSNAELMMKKDELSVVMMIDKLQDMADFAKAGKEIPDGYLNDIAAQSPEYLLDIIAQVAEVLLARVKVPPEEALAFTKQIKERRMGELFTHFNGYDVQATRRTAQTEMLLSIVRKKIKKDISPEDAADMLEEDVATIRAMYDLIQNHPDWDDDALCAELQQETESHSQTAT